MLGLSWILGANLLTLPIQIFFYSGWTSILRKYMLSAIEQVAPEGRAMFSHYAADQWHAQSMHDFVSASIPGSIGGGDSCLIRG